MSILYCGLNRTEYNRISSCETSKEIWTRLEVTHEGTDEVKQTRIRTLNRVYENFKMIPGEAIDSFFTRFADIVNPFNVSWENIHPRRVGDESFVVFERH